MTNPSKFWKAAIAVFILYVAADFVWHGWLFANFYNTRFMTINGSVMDMNSFPPFILAFEVMAALISVYFVQKTSSTMQEGMWNGALLGLFSSGAINFIGHSLISGWDLNMLLVDTLFGIVVGFLGGALITWMGGAKRA